MERGAYSRSLKAKLVDSLRQEREPWAPALSASSHFPTLAAPALASLEVALCGLVQGPGKVLLLGPLAHQSTWPGTLGGVQTWLWVIATVSAPAFGFVHLVCGIY